MGTCVTAARFDESAWSAALSKPDWFVVLADELKGLRRQWEDSANPQRDDIKREVRGFFERKLLGGEIALADRGENMDVQREPVDTIVIHHTSAQPGYTLPQMNAVHLLNLYVPYYLNPPVAAEQHLKGTPIWSGHFDGAGNPVFYAYHWLVRMDGSVERLLADGKIGWHAGNWEINKRSVAICIDNDYTDLVPYDEVLKAVAGLIRTHYGAIPHVRIFGHRDVGKLPTICPGELFEDGWKPVLLKLLAE